MRVLHIFELGFVSWAGSVSSEGYEGVQKLVKDAVAELEYRATGKIGARLSMARWPSR